MLKIAFIPLLVASLTASAADYLPSQQQQQKLNSLYKHLHQNPELSYEEKETSLLLAEKFKQMGFTVTTNIGGHGVVALFKNGDGPTVMLRADTDGLPIIEQTGKDYASKVRVTDKHGNKVGVMHGCGHDIHMTSLVGTAEQLIQHKSNWSGTLMLIAQPAEEVGAGAKAMLKDGLYTQFATPDYALGLHVSASLPAGKVAVAPGYALANVDSVDITVKGKGGHGAYPHTTVDPVVLASRIVLALQTVASREVSPLEPNVLTIGSIHGGSKHNIISNEVKLQLTLRSYSTEVRNQQIAAIKRITQGIAMSAGLEKALYPKVHVYEEESIPSTYNDPALAKQVKDSISLAIGAENVIDASPVMGGEDFGLYGKSEHQVPITMFWLGAVSEKAYQDSVAQGFVLPSLHSSKFAPDYAKSIQTGVSAMTQSTIHLFNKGHK